MGWIRSSTVVCFWKSSILNTINRMAVQGSLQSELDHKYGLLSLSHLDPWPIFPLFNFPLFSFTLFPSPLLFSSQLYLLYATLIFSSILYFILIYSDIIYSTKLRPDVIQLRPLYVSHCFPSLAHSSSPLIYYPLPYHSAIKSSTS